jgi:hypothetical protein
MKRSALDSLADRFPFRTHTSVCLRMRGVKVLAVLFAWEANWMKSKVWIHGFVFCLSAFAERLFGS